MLWRLSHCNLTLEQEHNGEHKTAPYPQNGVQIYSFTYFTLYISFEIKSFVNPSSTNMFIYKQPQVLIFQDHHRATNTIFNPLALELDIYSLAHHLCKMWTFYEPRRVTLGNTRHFVEE